MAAGVSGASGPSAVRTARGSAAESAQLQSPDMEDGCVTGWRWPWTTAPAACAHRVCNSHKNKHTFSIGAVSPAVGDSDSRWIIFGSVGYIMIAIIITLITSTLICLHHSSAHHLMRLHSAHTQLVIK